jgi:DNA polymerase-3 subunit delta'
MSFDALLGNERLKENISRSIQSGRASHFYLISGPEGSGKHTLATLLAAALLCEGEKKPCHTCPHCRKLLSGNHPDFIPVQDPEHKNLPVKLVRQIREDMFIRPNEGAKKIYMFHQDMGIEGQNTLLKVLEEPPSYGVFMILTENPDSLLPTIRSRCIHLSLSGLPDGLLLQELLREAAEEQLLRAEFR